jgi:hypothetical protein
VVVPAGGGFLHWHLTVLLQGQEVRVTEYVIEDLVVSAEPAALETGLGARPMELRGFEKSRILRGPKQSLRVDVWVKRRTSLDVDHARVDRRAAQVPGDRNSMVPVDDVVVAVDPINVDGR